MRSVVLLFASLGVALMQQGCDLFKTDDKKKKAEKPEEGSDNTPAFLTTKVAVETKESVGQLTSKLSEHPAGQTIRHHSAHH